MWQKLFVDGHLISSKNVSIQDLLLIHWRVLFPLGITWLLEEMWKHSEKFGLFSDFQYGFRSSQSTADLLTVVPDRIARAFNRSGAI